MRLFSFSSNGRAAIGVVDSATATEFVDLGATGLALATDMAELLAAPGALAVVKAAASKAPPHAVRPLAGIRFLPVVPRPPKILCLGLNYADHAKEGGHARPEYPSFFMRGATSQVGHNEPIIRPKASTKLDYEAELAVVIGARARHLTKANALGCVAGYACYNDGSVRDYQRKTNQWTIGKNFDATGGFGPWLVTADELPAGAAGLRIQSRLNGKVMQDANTKDFLFDVVESLCIITECLTLEPGDVIITGTPAGVGYARTPPVWMAPGDVCEIDIEGVGVLSNPIADEVAS
ncbi:MAG: fumarylacetoacetate hydrolase family protein [Burkholderiales bacterium]|nr:fumarylacetoacetate hydrolase family protein [Burkholderiales bacterium]